MMLSRTHAYNVEGMCVIPRDICCCKGLVSCHANGCIHEKENSVNLGSGSDTLTFSHFISIKLAGVILPNGDKYQGTLLGSVPDGLGKYIWADGCIYEGEWRKGMRHGHGRFEWPSGAIYDGEFSGGYMHGNGIYNDPSNLIYRGRWKINFKHGLGYQKYPNGDIFEGSWIQGILEGFGKYIWSNGNIYVGNMIRGKMSGKGTLTWKSGDTYEGYRQDGLMHGFGVYTWVDCGYYIGIWTRGLKDGKGYFYPKGRKIPARQDLYLTALRNRGLIPDFNRKKQLSRFFHTLSFKIGNRKVGEIKESAGGSSTNIQKTLLVKIDKSQARRLLVQRRWSLEVGIEKNIGCHTLESVARSDEVVGTDVPILEREYMQGVLISEVVINNSFLASCRKVKRCPKKLKDVKKLGETIIKGHRSYDLMLSLQLGIRLVLGFLYKLSLDILFFLNSR